MRLFAACFGFAGSIVDSVSAVVGARVCLPSSRPSSHRPIPVRLGRTGCCPGHVRSTADRRDACVLQGRPVRACGRSGASGPGSSRSGSRFVSAAWRFEVVPWKRICALGVCPPTLSCSCVCMLARANATHEVQCLMRRCQNARRTTGRGRLGRDATERDHAKGRMRGPRSARSSSAGVRSRAR